MVYVALQVLLCPGFELREFLTQIKGGKFLTLILISLIISRAKRVLITGLRSLANIITIGWLLKQHYLPVSLKNREH
ncbi:hypothetical protein B9X66_02930 [Acinetobacter pittii]|nr:hypothetical protein B9X66_02930 [Acinetobacter pittii]